MENKKSQKPTPENISEVQPETPENLKTATSQPQEESKPTQGIPAAPLGEGFKNKEADEYSLEVIEDWDGKVDITYLEKKDPNYKYRFLKADPVNLSKKTSNLLFQHGGWQICPRQHLIRLGLGNKLAPDGTYRAGDLVLAFMPKTLYEKKDRYKKKMADEPMEEVNRKIKQGDPSVAGIGHPNMKGIQTKDDLRM